MKTPLLVCIAALAALSPVLAHEGVQRSIPHLKSPDAITIDGRADDWEETFRHPVIEPQDLSYRIFLAQHDTVDDWIDPPLSNIGVTVWLAWSSDPPRILGYIDRQDDRLLDDFVLFPRLGTVVPDSLREFVRYRDPEWNDSVAIMVDADHSGGFYDAQLDETTGAAVRDNQQAQRYFLRWRGPGSRVYYGNSHRAEWPTQEPWVTAVGMETARGCGIEFSITAWDSLDYTRDGAQNTPHRFEAGQIIGLQVQVMDFDEPGPREESPSLVGVVDGPQIGNWWAYFMNADVFGDYLLVTDEASSVDAISWSQVKKRTR